MIFDLFYQTQLSTLGYLSLDVLVSEQIALPSEVTKYPVEDQNEEISDHITMGNEELTISGSISSSSSFGFEFGGGCHSKLIDAIDQLRRMHAERKPVKIVTGLGEYKDMAFTQLTITRQNNDKGGNWLDINADLRHIRKVSLKQTELPPDKSASGKSGTSEARSGQSGNANNTPKVIPGSTLSNIKGIQGSQPFQGATLR